MSSNDTHPVSLGPGDDATDLEEDIWATLDTIPDPHIPVSLVEMAMIYDVALEETPGGFDVTVEMTFPCMGCPAYDMILDDIRACLRVVSGVRSVDVDVVWAPIWEKDLLTPEVRDQLKESGIAI
jgi:metal-sulfur cluster biosynthetic enzyme